MQSQGTAVPHAAVTAMQAATAADSPHRDTGLDLTVGTVMGATLQVIISHFLYLSLPLFFSPCSLDLVTSVWSLEAIRNNTRKSLAKWMLVNRNEVSLYNCADFLLRNYVSTT